MLSIFSCALWPCWCLLWTYIPFDLGLYFYWADHVLILTFRSCLHVLEINMLFLNLVANILSSWFLGGGVVSLFHLSFPCCAKSFEVNEVPFVQFYFLFHFSKCGSKMNFFRFMSNGVLCSFPKRVRVIIPQVSSLMGLQFLFLYWVRRRHHFIHFSPAKEPHPALYPDCSQFTLAASLQEGSLFFKTSPLFIVCRLLDKGLSHPYELIAPCSFHLHFSNN